MKQKVKPQAPLYRGVVSRLEENIEGEIIYIFKYNLDPVNNYSYGAGAICGKKLYMCTGEEEIKEFDIDALEDIEYVQYVGCASIEYKIEGEAVELCRSDMHNAISMQNAVKRLKAIHDGRVLGSSSEDDATACPICGVPYRPGSKICPYCTDKKKLLTRMLPFMRPYLFKIMLGLGLSFLLSAGNLLMPVIHRILVNDYIQAEDPNISGYIWMVVLMAAITLVVTVIQIVRNNIFVKAGTKISIDMRETVYKKVQGMSLAGVGRRTAGELITRITSDTIVIRDFLVSTVVDFLHLATLFVGILVVMFIFNWQLTSMVLFPVFPIFLMFYSLRTIIHRMYHKQWHSESDVNTLLHDVFSGIRVVKVFGTEKYETDRFCKASRKVADISQTNERRWNLIMPVANFIVGIGEYVVLIYVGSQVINGQMLLGDLIMFVSYVGMLYGPIRWAAHLPRQITRAMTSMSKVVEILDEEPEINDIEGAVTDDIHGNIKLENASFGYNNYEDVLKKITLDINKGEMVGVVGRSGVGKSTMINLVLRLYDLTDGKLLIDGRDIREYDQNALRAQIGVVLQETYLFRGTIYTNIAYAKPECTPEEVMKAARIANAHQFIMKQPDAYNTYVGERGQTLSGGERQRIAIARTILRNPTILILDEATASLDTETEKLIQDSINKLVSGRTTIAIAHRLSTLRNATKLAVLEKGALEEVGTHDELMRSKGRYYKLVMAQRQMSKMKK